MRKILVIASTEFATAVRSKGFIIGIIMLPLIMGLSIVLQTVVAKRADTKPRPIAVVDETGSLYPAIARAAELRTQALRNPEGRLTGPPFEPQQVNPEGRPADELQLDLSDRIRRGELFAFVVLPKDLLDPQVPGGSKLAYHSASPTDVEVLPWLQATVNGEVQRRRLLAAHLDPNLIARINMPAAVDNLGLLSREAAGPATPGAAGGGRIKAAQEVDRFRAFAPPIAMLFIVFFVVMTGTPQLLNSVIEEKMSKISEVLLGSVTPMQLMAGKLLGGVAVALLMSLLYVGGALGVAASRGYADVVPPHMFAVLALFIVVAVILFGSIYLAIGSACSEIRDAQSLMMPVVILSMLPMFVWTAVLTNPSSPLAVGMSLFPTAAPFLMPMRMALSPAPPAWQVVLSIALAILSALAFVWAGSKIFRTGLLMQGKAPTFRELARWVVAR